MDISKNGFSMNDTCSASSEYGLNKVFLQSGELIKTSVIRKSEAHLVLRATVFNVMRVICIWFSLKGIINPIEFNRLSVVMVSFLTLSCLTLTLRL